MTTYPLGQSVHLRGLFWDAIFVVTVDPATDRLTTRTPHGLAASDTIAFGLEEGAPVPGGLDAKDGYNQEQIYWVLATPDAHTLTLAYEPSGTAVNITGAMPGKLYVLYDPSVHTCAITLPDGTLLTPALTPARETLDATPMVGAWAVDFVSTQVDRHVARFSDGAGSKGEKEFEVIE